MCHLKKKMNYFDTKLYSFTFLLRCSLPILCCQLYIRIFTFYFCLVFQLPSMDLLSGSMSNLAGRRFFRPLVILRCVSDLRTIIPLMLVTERNERTLMKPLCCRQHPRILRHIGNRYDDKVGVFSQNNTFLKIMPKLVLKTVVTDHGFKLQA